MDMAKDDIFSGLSVDKILSDVKAMQGEGGLKLWSLDDVDQLLAGNALSTDDSAPAAPVPVQKKMQAKPSEAAEAPTAQKPMSAPTSLKAAAKHIQTFEEAEFAAEEADDAIPALLPGVTPQTEEKIAEEAPEAAPVQVDPSPLPGQIAIEKTRVFNEVEARAVQNTEIAHKIGAKVIHTAAGEPKPASKKSAMETDAQRQRFLNRPAQKIEKTQEHKELLSKLPPKTIEKPGVIVRKPQEQPMDADGLQAIPTLVLPEDELREQRESETRIQEGSLKNYAAEGLRAPENMPLGDKF